MTAMPNDGYPRAPRPDEDGDACYDPDCACHYLDLPGRPAVAMPGMPERAGAVEVTMDEDDDWP